jgi:hypothetical protein
MFLNHQPDQKLRQQLIERLIPRFRGIGVECLEYWYDISKPPATGVQDRNDINNRKLAFYLNLRILWGLCHPKAP